MLKGFQVLIEGLTIKIPAELTETGTEIVKVFKAGETLLANEWGKWIEEIKTEVAKLEAQHGPALKPIVGVEVSVTPSETQPVDESGSPVPTPVQSAESSDSASPPSPQPEAD